MSIRSNVYRLDLNVVRLDLFSKPYTPRSANESTEDRPGYGWKHHRKGETLYAWKVRKDAPRLPPPWSAARVDRQEATALYARIIEYGFRRYLRVRGFRRIARSKGESFVDPQHNLLSTVLPSGADRRVGIFPEFQIQRALADDLRDPMVAYITITMKHRWDVAISVSELTSNGMDCSGLGARVVDLEGLPDLRDWADRNIGTIARVSGGVASLDDARNPALSVVPAAALHLEGSAPAMRRFLQTTYPRDWQAYWNEAQVRTADASQPRARLKTIDLLVEWLARQAIPLAPGLNAHIRRLQDDEAFHRGISTATPTIYVFDYASKLTGTIAARGLREHGPYDKSSPPKRRPTLTVLCPRTYERIASGFFSKLRVGCEYPNRRKSYLDHKGFAALLRLDEPDLAFVWFDSPTAVDVAVSYEDAAQHWLSQHPPGDLWFVVTEDAHLELETAKDPYCVIKALLFAHGVPVSGVTIEEMNPASPSGLPFTLANVTLQAYAKMGGVPFVFRAHPEPRLELVVGVGLADTISAAGRSRLVGFSAAFRTNGDFVVGGIGPPADQGDYVGELARLVEENLNAAIEREGAQSGAQLRVVFHMYKRPGRETELAAVETAIKKFQAFDVQCAYVQVNESHPWLVVDDRDHIGILPRGHMVRVDERTLLLNLIGPHEYLGRGYPAPLQIIVDDNSTNDIVRLAQQVFDFANVSWRGFNVSTLPVTILYAKLAAELAGKLAGTAHWNPNMLRTLLADKKWCL